MPTWTPRTTAPSYSSTPNPYYWPSGSQGECVWYCYYRALEGYGDWYLSGSDIIGYYPCWRTGSGSSGSPGFVDAKNWPQHYRDPWVYYDRYSGRDPVPGDVIIFTGTDGHNAMIESVVSGGYMVSDYNLASYHGFGYRFWDGSSRMSGNNGVTGDYIGFLHRSDAGPTPQPEYPRGSFNPSSATVTMSANENSVTKSFDVTILGMPVSAYATGNFSLNGLTMDSQTAWSYSYYTGQDGNTYCRADKTITVRYTREQTGAYTTTKTISYSDSFSTGSVNISASLTIDVMAKQGGILFLEWDGGYGQII